MGRAQDETLKSGRAVELKRRIDDTRRDMDEKLDELGQRLQPTMILDSCIRQLAGEPAETREQASHQLRTVLASMVSAVRRSPMATAVIAAGAGWLVYNELRYEKEQRKRLPLSAERRSIGHEDRSSRELQRDTIEPVRWEINR